MFATHEAVIDAPIEQIDLANWLFTLSDEDYQAASRGHRGAGTFTTADGVRGTVNIETVGGILLVQHYHEVHAERARVEMLSERTRGLIMHLIPAHFQVRWTLTATPTNGDATLFRCTVEVTMPTLLRLAAASIFTPYFVRKHVEEETPRFAADIRRKLGR